MKNINNDPKNNFNSEYERGNYLNFFGETLIFFGSILKLIWINENQRNKNKNQIIKKNVDHLISLINWGGRSSDGERAVHETHESARCKDGNHNGRVRLKQNNKIMWLWDMPAHGRSCSSGLLLRWISPDWSTINHHQN